MKRLTAFILVLTLLAALLAGCAKDPKPEETEAGETPMPKTKVEQLLSTISPEDGDYYRKLAVFAVDDLIKDYWVGDEKTGNLVPVWHGYADDKTGDERGAIWEAAEVLFNFYDMWVLTGEERYKNLMIAEADYYKRVYQPEEIETPTNAFNFASDDCAWSAMLFLCFYTVTGDNWFVERAENLLTNAYKHWHDDQIGGGLWYSDESERKSLYEAGIALDWLRLWEITGEQKYYDLAFESYSWMHEALGREDGLYFCETSLAGPVGQENPGRITEGSSCSFLGGNMAMAAMSAKFYKITGEQKYLDRVYKTNEGILKYYVIDGVLLNDRDAWTNGTFAAFYATEVLSLPDTDEVTQLLKDTAVSIITKDRTADGYYGGSWQGNAEGGVWASGGSKPLQTMTSGTTVQIIVAAALAEAGIKDYVR